MLTLTETAYYTRRIIKFGSIGLVVFLIARLLFGLGVAYWKKLNPPPPPPPTMAFGKLPALSFPQKEGLPGLSFKLETIEGVPPKIPDQAKVYFMPKPVASLLALDRAKSLARKLGFQNDPKQLSERDFQFTGQTGITLDIDIISQKLRMFYDFTSDQSFLAEKKLPNDEQSKSEAKSFLQQADLFSADLENGQMVVSYLRFVPPDLLPVISSSEADFVRVDIFRTDMDNLKVLPPNPLNAQIFVIFSGNRDLGKRVVEFSYSHVPASLENFATYPLKDSDTAWQELLEGKGYVAQLGENPEGRIVVRKIYLAYYESDTLQNFLQPIFVFEGDRNFTAYLSAVDPQWTE